MTDKPQPPHWLNPDAILGAVEHQGAMYYAVSDDRIDGSPVLCLVRFGEKHVSSGWFKARRCTLRPDLWPVKPELAALFGEATDATP